MKMYIRIMALLSVISCMYASNSTQSDAAFTTQAQQAIAQAFQSMEDWMNASLLESAYTDGNNYYAADVSGNVLLQNGEPVLLGGSYQSSQTTETIDPKELYPVDAKGEPLYLVYDENLKEFVPANLETKGIVMNPYASTKVISAGRAAALLDGALSRLEQSVFGESLQPIKDTMQRAISAFTTGSTIDNTVLRTMVNSLKLLLVAPVKAVYVAGGTVFGAVVGGVAGATMNLAVRGKQVISRVNKQFSQADTIKKIAQAIPSALCVALKGVVVDMTLLTAYAAAEHVVLGAVFGNSFAKSTVGSVFKLNPAQQKAKATVDSAVVDSATKDKELSTSSTDLVVYKPQNENAQNNKQPSAKEVVDNIMAEQKEKIAAANARLAAEQQKAAQVQAAKNGRLSVVSEQVHVV